MTTPAILFMTSAVISVTALAAWCYVKVLSTPSTGRVKKPDGS